MPAGRERFGSRQPGLSPRWRSQVGARSLAPGRDRLPPPGRSRSPSRRPTARSSRGCILAGFAVFAIGPAQIRGSRRRYVSSGAKDDPRDAWMLARARRADPDLFRRLELEQPLVLQLRERTRTVNELTCQRTRALPPDPAAALALLPPTACHPDLLNQLTHPWFRELWERAKTPALALKLRVSTLAKLLKKYGIRRLNAESLREILRAPTLSVAPVNRRGFLPRPPKPLRTGSHHQPTPRPGTRRYPRAAEGVLPGTRRRPTPRTTSPSSSPSPESGSTSSALSSPKPSTCSNAATTPRSAPAPESPPSASSPATPAGRSAASPSSTNSETASITGPASPPNTIPSAKPATAHSAPAATPTDAPSAPSATGSSPSPAPCSKTAPSTTPSSPETSSPPEQLLQPKKGASE